MSTIGESISQEQANAMRQVAENVGKQEAVEPLAKGVQVNDILTAQTWP